MIQEHKGHRSRMRERLERSGTDSFPTYELLEMLLFNLIPVRDTKPLAKRLLNAFSSLDELLSASRERLLAIDGIGARGALLIGAIDRLDKHLRGEDPASSELTLDSYRKLGDYLWNGFYSPECQRVIMLSLDSRMGLIGVDELYELDYSSAGVKPAKFIAAAVRRQATAVVIAHTHPMGAPIPSEGDRETNKLIASALDSVGVALLDHYILAQGKYVGFMTHPGTAFRQDCAFGHFVREKSHLSRLELECEAGACDGDLSREDEAVSALSELLKFSGAKDARGRAVSLIGYGGSLRRLLESELYDIECASDKRTAHLIKLAVALISRRSLDKLTFGKTHTREEIENYLKALYFMKPRETVYAVLMDKEGRVTDVRLVSEGTVSMSGIVPRRLLEVARVGRAESVIIAHNHPSGTTEPSNDDLSTTTLLRVVARDAGIEILAHYIVAGQKIKDILPLVDV